MEWGTMENLTEQQALDNITTGKSPYIKGTLQFDGHHIYSVDLSLNSHRLSKIIDPDNIAFGDRDQHFAWHDFDWKNHTSYVMIGKEKFTTINRDKMIELIKKAF